MDKHMITSRLLALPAEIAVAEEVALQAHSQTITAKEALQAKEDLLLLGNAIDGKNAEIRAAQMRQHTADERAAVADAEASLQNARVRLAAKRDELRALQAVAGLLQGEVA